MSNVANCNISRTMPTSVSITKSSVSICVGNTYKLKAEITPLKATQSVNWSSSNTSVATVDANGTVTAKKAGTAVITATSTLDSSKKASCTVTVNMLKIYQTKDTFRNFENGELPEDLMFNDKTVEQLRSLKWINWLDFVDTDASDLMSQWKTMCTTVFSDGDLKDVIIDMIDHFMDGSGSDYSNGILTREAVNHDSTKQYISEIKTRVDKILSENNGNISALGYIASTRDNNPLVKSLKSDDIKQPIFNTDSDKTNGLTICVDTLWGNQIEVKSYNLSGNSYSGVLTFTLYDHFGLDETDVERYGWMHGFCDWYILQHSKSFNGAYKPFVTIMEFDVPFSGTIK